MGNAAVGSNTATAPGIETKDSMDDELADMYKQAESFGNMFGGKHGEKQNEVTALVLDCGTGETKALFFKFHKEKGADYVEAKELTKAPAVLDFLMNKKAADNEDYKKKVKKINKDSKLSEEEKEKKIAKLLNGWAFLGEQPTTEDGQPETTLKAEHFIQFCNNVKNHSKDPDDKSGNTLLPPVNTSIIGCSAWAREGDAASEDLMARLVETGVVCKRILQKQEGAFEAAAVSYAFSKACPTSGDLNGLIGSGGGSVQIMHSMQYPVNLDIGNRLCLETMGKVYDAFEGDKLEALKESFKQAEEFGRKEPGAKDELAGRIQFELIEEKQRTADQYPDGKDKVQQKITGNVIAISACYYGAKEVGMDNNDDSMNSYPAGEVVKKMREKIEEHKQKLRDGEHENKGSRDTRFKAIANLTLQVTLFEDLLDPDCNICFKRNWKIEGHPFRTTWTAGWFLNFLQSKFHVGFKGSLPILHAMAQEQAQGQKLIEELNLDEFNNASNSEDIGLVLVDLKTIVETMRKLAQDISEPIERTLKKIKKDFSGDMKGYPDFKIKGAKSLFRKLFTTVKEKLEKNESNPAYTPNVEELVESIHDCLRYTMTFSNDQYRGAVLAIEEQLLGGPSPIANAIKFKNFWHDQDGETIYQGINAQVTLNPVVRGPDDIIPLSENFIFELQLHTHESYNIKDGPGHLIYEDFRDPRKTSGKVLGVQYDDERAYKQALYNANQNLYNTKKPDGTPLAENDVVLPGLKSVEHHKWTENDYTFKPYHPQPSIAGHNSTKYKGAANWVCKAQRNDEYHGK